MNDEDDVLDEQQVEDNRVGLSEIVFDAIYTAIRDALGEADLEAAIIEGMRIAADELLEQFMSQKTWMMAGRKN